jgi:hypothetical protein
MVISIGRELETVLNEQAQRKGGVSLSDGAVSSEGIYE